MPSRTATTAKAGGPAKSKTTMKAAKKRGAAKSSTGARCAKTAKPGTTCTVTVTPVYVDGKNVTCIPCGGCVEADAILVPQNGSVDITFELEDGPGGTYDFHSEKPFTNQMGQCPPPLPAGTVTVPFSLTSCGAKAITVHSEPTNGKAHSFYRLNFQDGYTWDPVIIHD